MLLAISATGPGAGSAVSGSRSILTLEFLVFAQGADDVRFEGQNLGGSETSALLDTNGNPIFVNWFAGMLAGQ